MNINAPYHKSVLLEEVIAVLSLKKNDVVIDATLGLGGHSSVILDKIGEKGFLYGFEWDKKNAETAEKVLQKKHKNFKIVKENFIHIAEEGIKADKILFDLGISSVHLDSSPRGFSFKRDEDLDMRMSDKTELTAKKIVNTYSEEEIRKILREYGDEKHAYRIAQNIVKNRPLESTKDLREIIDKSGAKKEKNPYTKTFQALRIAVNDEINNLKKGLEGAIKSLNTNGIIAVISFHSKEDKIVKNVFREISKKCICPKEIIVCQCQDRPKYKLLTRKVIKPTDKEIEENPRSRSARLRAIQKISN